MLRSLDNDRTSPLEDGFQGRTVAEDRDDAQVAEMPDKEWLLMFREALSAASTYQQEKLRTPWSRNYRAFNNRHISGSKYETYKYRNRSKLFKPKTRMAVRKNDATAAGALFSTEDVVAITPERASDPIQQAAAKFLHEVLNYRFDRTNRRSGPNWFLTSIGARQDTQLSGICVSKQFWEYETRDIPMLVDRMALDPNGLPVVDPMTGQPSMEQATEYETEIIRDRPMITLVPPEHAFIDPTGDWRDPIQEGGYFIAGFPVRLEDLEDMIAEQTNRPRMGGGAWRTDIDIRSLTQGAGQNQRQADAVRRAREDGTDRYESRHADQKGETIWLYETFYRLGGTDWHFWTLGEHIILSNPRPVEESYPEQKGDRPYIRGVGELESHKTHPTSPVETWQPMQQEMNEITNLGLDALKMSISPITKVKKGRDVDLKQVQNRGPDAHIHVTDADDVTFDRAPVPPNTQQALGQLNVDFDELAGVFSNGSVQTNRQLNETVGGMQLLASSANAMTEFDLRVWVETWVEPVLHQIVRTIMYYETDETIIAVAGEKAGLISAMVQPPEPPQQPAQPGMPPQQPQQPPQQGLEQAKQKQPPVKPSAVIEALDKINVTVRVNIGIGAMDSGQKLQKLMMASQATGQFLPLLERQNITLNAVELVQEIWGLAGYKDADRFYMTKPQSQEGPPPEVQAEMMKQKGRMEEKQMDGQVKTSIEQIKAQTEDRANQTDAALRSRELALEEQKFRHEQRMDEMEMALKRQELAMQRISDAVAGIAQHFGQPRQQGSTGF